MKFPQPLSAKTKTGKRNVRFSQSKSETTLKFCIFLHGTLYVCKIQQNRQIAEKKRGTESLKTAVEWGNMVRDQ
jgi:hypothetical protein